MTNAPKTQEMLDVEAAKLKATLEACVDGGRQHQKRFPRTEGLLATVAYLGVVGLMCTAILLYKLPPAFTILIFLPFLPLWVLIYVLRMFRWRRRAPDTEQTRIAVERLTQIDDPGVAPLLIDHWGGLFGLSVHRTLEQALVRLLPRMTEEEILELGTERHARLAGWISAWKLNSMLVTDPGTPCLLAMLRVMTVVGKDTFPSGKSGKTLPVSLAPTLRKWANGQSVGQNPEVCKAAEACLQAIQMKKAPVRNRAELLRAAPDDSEGLLRMAQGAPPAEPLELLRPGVMEEKP